ncbi:2Fe-2S iron-sulfur cluster-binding protein, partial [Deinococcus wulumuqiensis]
MTQTQTSVSSSSALPSGAAPLAPADMPMLQLKVKILRFNPESDKKAKWVTYNLEAQAGDRLVDVLNEIKWYHEPSLTFRRSCQHGICGSDA